MRRGWARGGEYELISERSRGDLAEPGTLLYVTSLYSE